MWPVILEHHIDESSPLYELCAEDLHKEQFELILILEGIQQWGGFHAEILKKPITWDEGYIIPPTGPGLGVELDEQVALAHPYEGTSLHLEMNEHPV